MDDKTKKGIEALLSSSRMGKKRNERGRAFGCLKPSRSGAAEWQRGAPATQKSFFF